MAGRNFDLLKKETEKAKMYIWRLGEVGQDVTWPSSLSIRKQRRP